MRLVSSLGDDWATLKMLNIMRRLPGDKRKRLLQAVELILEDGNG